MHLYFQRNAIISGGRCAPLPQHIVGPGFAADSLKQHHGAKAADVVGQRAEGRKQHTQL
jgi:hypothetical protein